MADRMCFLELGLIVDKPGNSHQHLEEEPQGLHP